MSEKYGRLHSRDGFVDAWVAAGHDESAGVTQKKLSPGEEADKRIDYCFVSAELASAVSSAEIDGACIASDHQPVWIELDF